MNFVQESVVIWRAELSRAVRSGRVVVLLGMYALFSLLVLIAVGAFVSYLREQLLQQTGADAEAADQVYEQFRQGLLGFLLSDGAATSEALTSLPIVVLVVFRITLLFLPAYVALMGFDQISGEVGPRSIRYLFVRARRSSVLAGKFLTQATLLLVLVLLVDLGITLYAFIVEPDFPLGAAVPGLVKLWLAASLFSLAYVALTTLCSALTRTPALSLALNFLVLFMFWLADSVGSGRAGLAELRGEDVPASAVIRFLSPSHYASGLLDPDVTRFLTSVGAYAVFATLFLLLAQLSLRVRDA